MNTLMTAIVLWLSLGFGIPADFDHPRIVLAPPAAIAALHRSGRTAAAAADAADTREIVSIYDDRTATIYLPRGWTGRTPAELSVLVHEIVHHLQNRAGWRYPCAQARERLAYAAQARWLRLFGTDLERAFDVDPFTLLVRTRCAA